MCLETYIACYTSIAESILSTRDTIMQVTVSVGLSRFQQRATKDHPSFDQILVSPDRIILVRCSLKMHQIMIKYIYLLFMHIQNLAFL